MFWHLSHRLTTVHYAVSIALLCSISSAASLSKAHAATIGQTTITSAQHEPLAANIMVADITGANFQVGLANSTMYQQMGLTPTDSMTARFVFTSANSGKVLINTTQPVLMPFADVVLTVNDNGQRNIVPKTLLMPLSTSNFRPSSNARVATAQAVTAQMLNSSIENVAINNRVTPLIFNTQLLNTQPLIVRSGMPPLLKGIDSINTRAINTQPLMVRGGNPPPLFAKNNASEAIQARALPQASMSNNNYDNNNKEFNNSNKNSNNDAILLSVNLSPISASSLGMPLAPPKKTAKNRLGQTALNMPTMTARSLPTDQTRPNNTVSKAYVSNIDTVDVQALTAQNKRITAHLPAINVTNKTYDVLTIQVTRRIQASDERLTIDSPNQPTLLAKTSKVNPSRTSSHSPLNAKPNDPKKATTKTAIEADLQTSSQHNEQSNNIHTQTIVAQI